MCAYCERGICLIPRHRFKPVSEIMSMWGFGYDPTPKPQAAGDAVDGPCKKCQAEKKVLAKIDGKLQIFCKLCGHKEPVK